MKRELTVLLSLGVSLSVTASEQRYIEAEDCEGLPRYAMDNEDAPGWYAHDAGVRGYGAPGRSWCAMINESSKPAMRSMSQRLIPPLPPGRYRLFLRTRGPVQSISNTVVRVTLRKAPEEASFHRMTYDDFAWHGKLKPENGGQRVNATYSWRPGSPAGIELSESVDTVTFTAVEFGGAQGMGTLHEMIARVICIDTLYITSDISEQTPPAIEAEYARRAGADVDAWGKRPDFAADESGAGVYQTPMPENPPVVKPVLLAAFDGRKNLWPNSSCELGVSDWTADSSSRGCFHIFQESDLDSKDPAHGTYAIRVPPPFPVTGVPKGYPLNPFSRIYNLATGGVHTLSVSIRGEGPVEAELKLVTRTGTVVQVAGVETHEALKTKGPATNDWRRLSVSGNLAPGEYALYFSGDKEFEFDAIQLEAGETATPYAPRAEVEVALRTAQPGNILYEDDAEGLVAWVHNSGEKRCQASIAYRIVDVRERVVAEGQTEALPVQAGKTLRRPLPILPKLKGLFSVQYALAGRQLPEGETVLLVMPKPAAGKTRHVLGANFEPSEGTLDVNARLGVKWVTYAKTLLFAAASRHAFPGMPQGVHPRRDEWNWADREADLFKRRGLENQPSFWPRMIPAFMGTRPEPVRTCTFGEREFMPQLELWKEHVAKVVEHYRGKIDTWCIDDEADFQWHLAHLAPLVKATGAAAHQASPQVRIGINANPEAIEELQKLLGPDCLDCCGGSLFDFNYWQSRYVRRLKEQYGKPWICYGVGQRYPLRSMYHTFVNYEPCYDKAAHMARNLIMLLLVQDLDVASVYTGVLKNSGLHVPIDKPLCDYDGVPLPWGASFAILGANLADAEPLPEAEVGTTGRYAHMFRIGDRVGAVTWGTSVREYDHNFRPAQRELKGLKLPLAREQVAVLDMYWNPRKDVSETNGGLCFDVTEEPVFIMANEINEQALRSALAEVTVQSPPVDMAIDFVASGSGGIDVGLKLTNRTQAELKDVSVDFRFGEHRPYLEAGAWLLKQPVAKFGAAIPVGGQATLSLPTVLDGSAPYEGGILRANVRAANGMEAASDQALWLLPASAIGKTPVLDAKLDEWESRIPAFLAYDWSWAPSSRSLIQLGKGGEHFGYPCYRVDARGAFWAGWDADNLYLAIRLDDDEAILDASQGENVTVVLSLGGTNATFRICPLLDGKAEAVQLDAEKEKTPLRFVSSLMREERLNGALAQKEPVNIIRLEGAIPWSCVGVQPRPGSVLGFDLFWSDADHESNKLVQGTLHWAGQSKQHGYLLLRMPDSSR